MNILDLKPNDRVIFNHPIDQLGEFRVKLVRKNGWISYWCIKNINGQLHRHVVADCGITKLKPIKYDEI